MTKPRIAVAAYGNPTERLTWSGTPANVIGALEKLGVTVETIDFRALSKWERLFYFAVYQAWRIGLTPGTPWKRQFQIMRSPARTDFNHMAAVRNRRTRYVEKEMRRLKVTQVVHMQPYAAPIGKRSSAELEHFLIFDSTTWTEAAQQQAMHLNGRPEDILQAFKQIERETYNNLKHLFPIAEYLREDLAKHFNIAPEKMTVIGTGLGGLKPFQGEKDYANGHILCVARTRFDEKGGPLLMDAFQLAYRVNPKLKLVLVGNEEYKRIYGSLPGVTVHGMVSWEELQQLFNTAALFAMPALIEPYGLVFQEALAGKTPILGLRRNAVPEFCDNGRYGFMVDKPEPQLVADALLEAMSDPARLKRMGEEGQRYILGKYSWEKTARRICEGMGITAVPSAP